MSSSDLQTIQNLLPKLTPDERKKVRLAVDFLSRSDVSEDEDPTHGGEELLFEICKNVLDHAGLDCPHFARFKSLDIYRAHFKKNHKLLVEYTENQLGSVKRSDRQKFYRLAAELVIENMKQERIPMKLGLFFRDLKLVPGLMSRAFPGYAEQGWLSLILSWGDRSTGA